MKSFKGNTWGKTALLLSVCIILSLVFSVTAFAADRSSTVGSRSYTRDTNGNGRNGTGDGIGNRAPNSSVGDNSRTNGKHYTDKTNKGTGNADGDVIGNGGVGSVGNGVNGNNNSPAANGGGVVTDDVTTKNDMYGGIMGDTSRPIEEVIPGDDEIDGDTRDEIHKDTVRNEDVMGEEEGEVLGVTDTDGSVVGIVIAILIAVAVIVLIIALIPKGTSSM